MGNGKGRPGDLVISAVHGGFLIGQLLDERGPGPWWGYVATAGNLADAIELAQQRAELECSQSWLQSGHGDYVALPRLSELALVRSAD
jgi:hypothetical protein